MNDIAKETDRSRIIGETPTGGQALNF